MISGRVPPSPPKGGSFKLAPPLPELEVRGLGLLVAGSIENWHLIESVASNKDSGSFQHSGAKATG